MASHGASARVEIKEDTSFNLTDDLIPINSKSGDQKPNDPINWFCGVLVPLQLRQAQSCFRRSIRLVTELASRRAALLQSAGQLTELLGRRKRLEAENPLISLSS